MPSTGLIMVDPIQNIQNMQNMTTTTTDPKQMPQNVKKNRKNKKKNKSKTEEENSSERIDSQSKIVTLRNPLFQGNDVSRSQQPMPLQQRNQLPLNINQPASIIKNDNGMFTIRNMALHQAITNGVGQNYRPYAGEMYQAQDSKVDNYSYFSDGAVNTTNSIPTNAQDNLRTTCADSTPFYGNKR